MENDLELYDLMIRKYPDIYRCVEKIAEFIESSFSYELSEQEKWYLMIHIHKITS